MEWDNIGIGRIEIGVPNGDLMVDQIIYHIRRAEERVAQNDFAITTAVRYDAKYTFAVLGAEDGTDELVQRDVDECATWSAELEGEIVLARGYSAVDHRIALISDGGADFCVDFGH